MNRIEKSKNKLAKQKLAPIEHMTGISLNFPSKFQNCKNSWKLWKTKTNNLNKPLKTHLLFNSNQIRPLPKKFWNSQQFLSKTKKKLSNFNKKTSKWNKNSTNHHSKNKKVIYLVTSNLVGRQITFLKQEIEKKTRQLEDITSKIA